jgi:hypothetical protein
MCKQKALQPMWLQSFLFFTGKSELKRAVLCSARPMLGVTARSWQIRDLQSSIQWNHQSKKKTGTTPCVMPSVGYYRRI